MSDIDVEQLIHNIETYDNQYGAEGKPPEPEKEVPKEPGFSFDNMDALLSHKLKYETEKGKEVEEDLATILKRAKSGYHFAQNQEALNSQRSEWEQKVKAAEELQQRLGRFEEYDRYARENPEWNAHVQRSWENRNNPQGGGNFDGQTQADPLAIERILSEKIKPYEEKFQKLEQEELKQKVSQEDDKLEQEINAIRKHYADIDFDHSDPETGETLEYSVLRFGAQNGLKDFSTAFKAFYHDKLVQRERDLTEKKFLEQHQEKKRQGIISESNEPSRKAPQVNTKLSYDQITEGVKRKWGFG